MMIKWMMMALALATGLATSAAPVCAQETLEEIVEAHNPAAVAMHKYFPDDFAAMIAALKAQPSREVSVVRATALPFVTRLMTSHSDQIDEAASIATLTLTMDEMKAVREKSPASCLALINGKAATVDQGLFSPELQARYTLNTAAAFEQIALRPAPHAQPMTTDELADFAQRGYQTLPDQTRAIVRPIITGQPPQTYGDVHAMCDLYLAMLDAVLHGPDGSVRSFMAMAAAR